MICIKRHRILTAVICIFLVLVIAFGLTVRLKVEAVAATLTMVGATVVALLSCYGIHVLNTSDGIGDGTLFDSVGSAIQSTNGDLFTDLVSAYIENGVQRILVTENIKSWLSGCFSWWSDLFKSDDTVDVSYDYSNCETVFDGKTYYWSDVLDFHFSNLRENTIGFSIGTSYSINGHSFKIITRDGGDTLYFLRDGQYIYVQRYYWSDDDNYKGKVHFFLTDLDYVYPELYMYSSYVPSESFYCPDDWNNIQLCVPAVNGFEFLLGSSIDSLYETGDTLELTYPGIVTSPDDIIDSVSTSVTTGTDICDLTISTDVGEIEPELPENVPSNLPSLSGLFITKFPFSIPWDVYSIFTLLDAEPEAPHFSVDLMEPLKDRVDFEEDTGIELDMEDERFEVIGTVIRWGVLISFLLGLAFATKKLIWTA